MADDFVVDVAEVAGHGVVVVATGEVDMLTAPRLRAALLRAASLGDQVVVDLGRVEFMDSTGLSALVDADASLTAAGKQLRLSAASPAVQRLLQLTGLHHHFAVVGAPTAGSPADAGLERQLTQIITELASILLTEHSLHDDLEQLIRFTCELMPHCSAASVALVIDGAPATVAVSEHVALELDIAQYDTDDGPCLAALGGGQVRVDVLGADGRFEHFARGAAHHDVNSVLSMPITHGGGVVGTLNFYGRQRHAFDDTAEGIARLAGTQAAHAIVRCEAIAAAHDRRDQLQARYDEMALVARAQGVLIAAQACSAEQARHLLESAAAITGDPPLTVAQRILAAAQDDTSR